MKILLLGKSGMLGSCFLKYLSGNANFEMYAYGREDLDILDFEKMSELFAKISPDFVLNCAAYTAVDDCENCPDVAFGVNAQAVGQLAKLCKQEHAILMHFSTDYVFDGENGNGYGEDALPHPLNVYGESKLEGERLIAENLDEHYIVRTSWLFGENGKNFVDTMVKLGREREELGVVGDQVGCPTYTKDLCEAVVNYFLAPYVQDLPEREGRSFEREKGSDVKLPFGIYHLSNSGTTSWHAFAVKIFEIMNMPVKVNKITSEEFVRPAKRPKHSVLLNTKGDYLLRPWSEAVEAYLKLNF